MCLIRVNKNNGATKHLNRPLINLAGILGFFSIAFYKFDSLPPLWWDEGWTLTVARTWAETGVYGIPNAGQMAASGLAGHFPVIAITALSFQFLGIGALQGRLMFVLLILASFFMLFLITRALYSEKSALAAVLMTVLLPISDEINPLMIGRQVLGEPAMLFFALLGYFLLWKGLKGKRAYLAGAAAAWGAALTMKAQFHPFWLASIGLTVLILLWQRQKWQALLLALTGIGAYSSYRLLIIGFGRVLSFFETASSAGAPVAGVLDVSGFVPDLAVRVINLQNVVTFAWWIVLGLALAAWSTAAKLRSKDFDPANDIVRILLLTLSMSWLGWYLALGMLWIRYLFPVVFIGSIFAAAGLERLTHGFDLKATLAAVLHPPSQNSARRIVRTLAGAGLACLAALSAVLTISVYAIRIFLPSDNPAAAADFIDSNLPSTALIETYDPEVIFLSDASFHFPPDHVHVQLIRRAFIDPSKSIDYDPLAASPDYLLVGPFSGRYGLYDDVIASGAFELEAQFPGYTLYHRTAP